MGFSALREEIARMVRDGFTSGYYPTWSLEAAHDVLEDESAIEHIASLIEEGFTSGYEPV